MDTFPVIVFRCDGSHHLGLGHVMRCLALADELYRQSGCHVLFVIQHDEVAIALIHERGYSVNRLLSSNPSDFNCSLFKQCENLHAEILVLDIRDDLPRSEIQALRRQGVLIVTIDDPTERRLDVDLAFYPPIPQVLNMDWTGFTGQRYVGWEWVILRSQFSLAKTHVQRERPVILVTMGGSDPAGLTAQAVEGLNAIDQDFEMIIVLGAGFQDESTLERQLCQATRPYTILRNVTTMWTIMAQADLSLATFGGTAYELAAMHVPSVLVGLTSDHVISASAFVDAGLAVCLGEHQHVLPSTMAKEISMLLAKPEILTEMRHRALGRVDGRGSERVAQTILHTWKEQHGTC